jgi:VRR-NUC domain
VAVIAEISIHIKAVHELRKRLLDGWIFWHTPNGELRDSARALSKLTAMGMLAGVPDIVAISPEGKVHFLEFKSENGALDQAQRDFQLWAIRANLPHSVVRSVDEAMKVFRFWGAIPEAAAGGPQS